ncbi:MAG: hypothetical protein HY964_03960 [Ignavibacteriales bacterium]|nr:hypothetical protein [Ignavibacteriales bacterium]
MDKINLYGKYNLVILILIVVFNQQSIAQYLTPRLTEKEVQSVIPILKSEIAGYSRFEGEQKTDRDRKRKLFEAFKSGKIDPLDWLKQHSKHVIAPSGAVYEPNVSRAVSIRGWDLPKDPEVPDLYYVLPTAIFTFGKEIPAINKYLLGKKITQESYKQFRENPFNMNDPSYKEIRSILEKTRTFYSGKGFSSDYSMDGYTVGFYPMDADEEISGTVWQVQIDLFDPLYPDVVRNSASHPMGPSIEIKAVDKLMEKVFQQADIKLGIEDSNIKASLKKAGITEDRYAEIKSALLIAREGSQNPEEEEPAAPDITPSTPEEKEAFRAVEQYREEIRAKKNNIRIYLKFKTELDPILDILQKYTGGKY